MKRQAVRLMGAALGAATICCFWITAPLVSPSHDAVYHWSGPPSNLFIPAVLDFTGVWLVFLAMLLAAQTGRRAALAVWAGLASFLPWAALKSFSFFKNWTLGHWASRGLFGLCLASFILLTVLLRSRQTGLQRLQKATTAVLGLAGFYGALVLLQLTWFGWQARNLGRPPLLHQAAGLPSNARAGRPRVIWILLDELSFQQVYGQRFPTLSLPAFDRLAKQSVVFTHVIPAGISTALVMPSLITGKPIDKIQPSPAGNALAFHNPLTRQWQSFDPSGTVFQDALSAGYKTAVAGWYNPYCRILPRVLDECFWTFDAPVPNRMLPYASLARNAFNPFLLTSGLAARLPSAAPHEDLGSIVAASHIADYLRLRKMADKLLQDPSLGFSLIHMPIPHPGGIYNRADRSFALHGSNYLDNLALADLYLAHVRSLLESTGQWDSSAIIIMGDHSWRTQLMWAAMPDWTPEEQLASNGSRFDDRPAYIFKLPGEKDGSTMNIPFAAVHTRTLLNAIMKNQVTSTQELAQWVQRLAH